ncbi:uncharacterized protein LOC130625086 [Hydractinia symbiolongicarpus]|uniref:uncharacterized protein LOC130625086 n=1 Tax=Hydractinia symbiolongicarpus TaxID=13093 RepID=UPI00254DED40|nr:uncharacterized protein LOC130625086 [Hydractinia symbiolongicarpus]
MCEYVCDCMHVCICGCSAILNVGWCYSEQDKEQIQSNDYVSNTSNIFQIRSGDKYYHVDITMEKNENSGGGKSIDGKVGDKNYIFVSAIGGVGFLFVILLLVCVACVCKGRKRANSENARRSNNKSPMGSLRKDRIMVDFAVNEYNKRQKAKENVYVDLPAYRTEAPPSYTVFEDKKSPIYDEIAACKAWVEIE